MKSEVYDAMARLLTYPDAHYSEALSKAAEVLPAECGAQIVELVQSIGNLPVDAQQELFTLTFDLNPVCSLELGWHLFGENYERGLLLVRLREELRTAGITEEGELPDHLAYALRLIPRMDTERAEDFVSAIVLPALMKMLQALRGKNNPYEHLLLTLASLLRVTFPEIPLPQPSVELPVLPQEVSL